MRDQPKLNLHTKSFGENEKFNDSRQHSGFSEQRFPTRDTCRLPQGVLLLLPQGTRKECVSSSKLRLQVQSREAETLKVRDKQLK